MHALLRPAVVALLGLPVLAWAAPPTHCKPGEHAIVDAWMGKVKPTDGGWRSSKTGKVVSLCADRKAEPFSAVTYRYGMPGKVELEVVATPQNRFGIASVSTSPRTGSEVVFFRRGEYAYYVAMATGMGSGVSLAVFQGQKQIVDHFSGNERDDDYQLGPAEIRFEPPKARSPVLVFAKPTHALK